VLLPAAISSERLSVNSFLPFFFLGISFFRISLNTKEQTAGIKILPSLANGHFNLVIGGIRISFDTKPMNTGK